LAKNNTSITTESRKEMPSRGRSKRTLILESLKEKAFKGLKKDATTEECEKAWFGFLVDSVVDPENKDSSMCLRLITERGWAALKPVSDSVAFEFDKDADLSVQASQILDAVSNGNLAVEHGIQLVGAIKGLAEIIAHTELKQRIEEIEKQLGAE